MKKRTFYAITASVILSTAIISCGSETTDAPAEEATTETATEEVAEEITEEPTASISGEELFASKGCVACHQPDAKTVGPSVKEIGEAYVDNAEGLNAF